MIVAFLFLFPGSASAADVVAPVPRPEAWAELLPSPARDPLADAGRIEFGVSAWSPQATEAPSRVGGTGAFERTGLPELRAAYVSPALLAGRLGRVSLRGGLGFAELTRAGADSTLPGLSRSSAQNYYLYFLRAGAEWRPFAADRTGIFEPRLSASLLPAIGIATRSALDDGGTHFGLPIELEAAIGISPFFQVGASVRAGRVDWVSLLGAGVNAGLSFEL